MISWLNDSWKCLEYDPLDKHESEPNLHFDFLSPHIPFVDYFFQKKNYLLIICSIQQKINCN